MGGTQGYFVYILASKLGGTLYVGVTNNLVRRVFEHKSDAVEGFTEKYGIHHLVYFEQFDDIENAIRREKRIKKWNRTWKVRLIEESIPTGLTSIRISQVSEFLVVPANGSARSTAR